MGTRRSLKIRLLGELRLVYGDGPALVLPASKKTRALLGYLIATGQAHRRERLCDLLWDGPDDPRAELRWSLSKLRPLLKDGGAHMETDRERVGIEVGTAAVDLLSIRTLLSKGVPGTSTEALKQVASQFGGEFLDGLDLPLCYLYQEWCMAEREAVSRLRLAVLSMLAERLHDRPDDALPYARSLTIADPLNETGHAAVVRLLSRSGRNNEALNHYDRARRIFETEFGAPPSEELEEARRALKADTGLRVSLEPVARATRNPPESARKPTGRSNLIGRKDEHALIRHVVANTARREASDILLVTGEPGIGKSHLLGCVGEYMLAAGGTNWTARGFEPETIRPYGVWLDLLRGIVRERAQDGVQPNLGMLIPELGAAADPVDRGRLFEAVTNLLQQIASKQPAAIVLDDIQWIDEASASLLHYVARQDEARSGLLLVCAARAGEIEDNPAVSSVLRSLSREGRLQTIELGPLGPDETKQLVGIVDPELNDARIFAESEGNPLFALELARAHCRGEAAPSPTVETIIAGQFARLTEEAREVLVLGAAHGRAFTPDDLVRAGRFETTELLASLGELERRGLVRPVDNDAYDFAHDLVRQTAYRTVSQPRRKFLHRHIARALGATNGRDDDLAADIAYHAGLADDHEVAASACAIAGERALRLFANSQAAAFAERGLRHLAGLAEGATKLDIRIRLLKLRILAAAGPGMRPLPPLIDTVAEAANAAEKLGLHAAAATAHYLLSVLHQEAGHTQRAETSTLRAAMAGRSADGTTRANQLANTARCLLELETQIERSRELIREGNALVDPLGLELCELHWARGLLHRWDGEAEMAVAAMGRALAIARNSEDRWREYKCLTWLAILERESGRYPEMRARCAELTIVAARLGEDETPFVATLQALELLAAEESSAADACADALERLRKVDDKSYLAYALNSAAHFHLQAGRLDQARLCAEEALEAAAAMGRKNEFAVARAILGQSEAAHSGRKLERGALPEPDWNDLSARARSTVLECQNQASDSNGTSHVGRVVLGADKAGDQSCLTSSSNAASRRRSRRKS